MSTMTIDEKTSNLSMNEFETMRESKVAYEYILDILQNSVVRMDIVSANELRNAMEVLECIYESAYQNIKNNKNKEEHGYLEVLAAKIVNEIYL